MTARQLGWISLLFIWVFGMGVIANMPVRQLLRFVEIPPGIGIYGLQGSISRVEIDRISFKGVVLSDISAELSPICFLKFSICYDLFTVDETLNARVQANLISGSVLLKDSRILLSESVFEQFPQMLVQPKGRFHLFIQEMVLEKQQVTGMAATLDWVQAGIKGEDQILGDYRADIKREANRLDVQLSDNGSLLSVSGDMQIMLDGVFEVDLKLTSRPSLNPSVISLLEMASKKTGLNRYAIKQSGKLPVQWVSMLRAYLSPV